MSRLFASAAFAVVVSACGLGRGSEFGDGVPQASEVALKVPGNSQALTGSSTRQGLEGETAEFYKLTRGVTQTVNAGTAAVLNLVHRVTEHRPTTTTEASATWGPHTDALSPNTWKLTVTRTATSTYDYRLEGKGKTEADSAFRIVLSGTHHRTGENLGSGSFLIDWDELQLLPEHDDHVGSLTITYARETEMADTSISAQFNQVKGGRNGARVDATYRYLSSPNQGGEFEFQALTDVVGSAAVEDAKVKSRWLQTGDGRSDARVSGGDLAVDATASECWDSNFASRWFVNSWNPSENYGAEAACAFTTAEYSTL
ncbi:MAG: hypothetical protein ACO1OB_16320 [Archangium sp.]